MGNKDGFVVHVNTFLPAVPLRFRHGWELGRVMATAAASGNSFSFTSEDARKSGEREREGGGDSRTVGERNPRVDKLGAFLSFL